MIQIKNRFEVRFEAANIWVTKKTILARFSFLLTQTKTKLMYLEVFYNRCFLQKWLTPKTLMIMRLIFILTVVAFLHASADGYGQKVTISTKDASLESVFKEIKKQTGYNFIFNYDWLQEANKVTIDVEKAPLDQVLEICFKNQPFTYEIVDKTISLKRKVVETTAKKDTISGIAPEIEIHGKILDQLGNPVGGSSVTVKGTKTFTSTDDGGNFRLKNITKNAILVVSHIGFEVQEIKIQDGSDISVRLKEHTTTLNQVSVVFQTGYQAVPLERATGSFAQPDRAMFENRVSSDVLSKLSGITSGLSFNLDYLANPSLQIRGASTINTNTSPLIVVDNFPYEGDINNINPNDVENVTILKDAAAASIWGARAGNGVIVITTKKGKFNQPLQIDISSNFTISKTPDLNYNRNFLGSKDFIDLEQNLYSQGFYDADLSDPTFPPVSPVVNILNQVKLGTISSADANLQINKFRSYDVRKDFKNGFYRGIANQQYALNISAGSQNANFVMSVGYDKDASNLVRNNNYRVTTNSLATFRPIKRLEITGGINFVESSVDNNNNISDVRSGGPLGKSIYPYAQFYDSQGQPLSIVRDYNGSFVQSAMSNGYLDWSYNPIKDLNLTNNVSHSYDARLRAHIKYEIIQGLNIEGQYQYETGNNKNSIFQSDSSYYTRNLINLYSNQNSGIFSGFNIPFGGILNGSNTGITSNNGRLGINFNRVFGLHSVNAVAGVEARETKGSSEYENTVYGYDPTTSSFSQINYTRYYSLYPSGYGGSIPNSYNIFNNVNRYRSYYANASYSFKEKYTFSASGRIDQANLFGQKANARSVPLWSLGGKWNISKEAFYRSGILPYLGLRATYGFQGNLLNSGTAYTTAQFVNGTANLFPPSYYIASAGNPGLTWEKTAMFNAGLDFAARNNIFSGSIEYYHKNGRNLIGNEPIPSSSGFTTATINYGDMTGHGFDVILNTKNISGIIQWTSRLIVSTNSNEVTNYFGNSASQTSYTIEVGRPIDGLYSYRWAGLDPTNGNPLGFDTLGKISSDYSTLVSAKTRQKQYNGRVNPPLFGGLRNTVSYKGFSLSFNLSYKFDYYFIRSSINYYSLFYSWQGNVDYLKRWMKPGDEKYTQVPSLPLLPANQSRDQFYNGSSVLVTKADQIRIQDAYISYDINTSNWHSQQFKHIQVLLYANNLGIIWKANKEGIDPDYYGAPYVTPRSFAVSLKASL